MDIPFKLKLTNNKDNPYKYHDIAFFSSENDINSLPLESLPEFKELTNLYFLFESYIPDLHLYMDGFEMMENPSFLENKVNGKNYLVSSTKWVPIYSIKDNCNVPLIPGIYQIAVKHEDHSFYSWINITTKSMSLEEWKIMKEDIEDTVSGLSLDLIKRETSFIKKNKVNNLNIPDIQKIDYLLASFSKLMSSLESIEKNPRNEIAKNYNWKIKGKSPEVDLRSIMQANKHPEKNNYVYSPKRYINYDIEENRWMKFFMEYFIKYILSSIEYLEKYRNGLMQQQEGDKHGNKPDSFYNREYNELDTKIVTLIKFKGFTHHILDLNWMATIKKPMSKNPPRALTLDYRYNVVYQLYLAITSKKNKLTLNREYQYFWKRTDLLYEIWGYIQVVNSLIEIGYKPIEGWIFSQNYEENKTIPFLSEGTTVKFRDNKMDTEINLAYNVSLPHNSVKTNMHSPIYTTTGADRPDIRMDIIKEGIYLGSLILDTKYKPLRNIWDSYYYVRENRYPHKISYAKKTMDQIKSYRFSTVSKLFYIGLSEKLNINEKIVQKLINDGRPVIEAWVLYPHYEETRSFVSPLMEEGIRLFELSPKVNQKELCDELKIFIDKQITAFW